MGKNNREHVMVRLSKKRPDLLERVTRGELSANAAAIEAGFRKRRTRLERAKAAAGALDGADRAAFRAWYDEHRRDV